MNGVAIPAELAESMLFGHVRGSFTGATADRKGWFELADGGTLFLDEIGDMAPALQAKLLRVLEDGQVVPVGASQAKRVDVRVVAATNADLDERIADGLFRQDLYFRLAQYRVEMPPLRERPEDIGLLAEHFLTLFAADMGVPRPALTQRALELLESYTFPGNVRELKNMIEARPHRERRRADRAGSSAPRRTCLAPRVVRGPRAAACQPAAEPRGRRARPDPARPPGDRRERRRGGAAARRESQPHLPEVPSRRRLLTCRR